MQETTDTIAEPQAILDFWGEAGPKRWWKKDEAFDAAIAQRFSATNHAARTGRLDGWRHGPPDHGLALVIVLDQFTRNLNRGSWRAFAADAKSIALVHSLMADGTDRRMRDDIGEFCYLPLMHSETLADQAICVAEMTRLDKAENIKAAVEHHEIIEKFGRFPHRNAVLGRVSTPAEIAFLEDGGFSG